MSRLTLPSKEQHAPDERAQLFALLKHKLRAIPPYHLPALTLDDIILQTSTATHMPNIPADIQLPFFLRHRALLARDDDRPLKSEEAQSMNLTRAIWFYRLDAGRQFQRYHDSVRWNLAMFTALLALASSDAPGPSTANTRASMNELALPTRPHYPLPSSRESRNAAPHARSSRHARPPIRDTYMPLSPSATRFMKQYIAAVLEHHNTPRIFSEREAFLQSWKKTRWDLFSVQAAGQKKALKNEMKRLSAQWEIVLDAEMETAGRALYDSRVGRFVGCVVPGRKDRCGGSAVGLHGLGGLYTLSATATAASGAATRVLEAVEGDAMQGVEGTENELLDALRVPFLGQGQLRGSHGSGSSQQEEETSTVTDLRSAIAAVQTMGAGDILSVLVRIFPAGE